MRERVLAAVGVLFVTLHSAPVLAQEVGTQAPGLGSEIWLNSAPLHIADLKGNVVLVEFWTFGCYNCRNVEPHIKQWHQKYASEGFVIIGVHSLEFFYEHDRARVTQYLQEHDIRFPVCLDNDFSIWKRYRNRYWPAMYLIDKRGIIRYVRIGEGGYQETEERIRNLLADPS